MWNWFASRCPVELRDKVWVERRMQWLIEQFGATPLLEGPTILPTPEFFPDPYNGTVDDVAPMFARVCKYMRVPADRFELKFFDADKPPENNEERPTSAAGFYAAPEGLRRTTIGVATTMLSDPLGMVATLAHEVAHDRLLGEGRLTGHERDHEPLTDLTTVFFGLGIFPANTAFRTAAWNEGTMQYFRWSTQGYLKDDVFGYALAVRAWLRGELSPSWSSHLTINPRTAFRRGAKYLDKTEDCAFHRGDILNGTTNALKPSVDELLNESNTRRLSALMGLWESRTFQIEQVDAVVENLWHSSTDIVLEAIRWLETQEELPVKAVHRLIVLMRNGEEDVALWAAWLLGQKRPGIDDQTPEGLRTLDELVRLATRLDWNAKVSLAELLAAFGPKAHAALKPLIQTLHQFLVQGNGPVSESLVDSMLRIDPGLDQRLPREWSETVRNLYQVTAKSVRRSRHSTRKETPRV